jgi:hypothetical protein
MQAIKSAQTQRALCALLCWGKNRLMLQAACQARYFTTFFDERAQDIDGQIDAHDGGTGLKGQDAGDEKTDDQTENRDQRRPDG